jgi:hypothetical protein
MSVDAGKDLFRLGFLTAIEVPERGYVGGLLVTNHFGRPLEFQCTAPLKPNRTQEILYGPTLVPYLLGDLIGRTLLEKVGVKPHLVLTERQELLGLRELVEIPVACVDDLPANAQIAPPAGETTASTEPEPARTPTESLPTEEPIEVVQPTVQSIDSTLVEAAAAPGPGIEATVSDAPTKIADSLEQQLPRVGTPGHEVGRSNNTLLSDVEENSTVVQLGRQVLRFHAAHAGDKAVASRGARVVPNNADLREPFERVREALGETARMGGAR